MYCSTGRIHDWGCNSIVICCKKFNTMIMCKVIEGTGRENPQNKLGSYGTYLTYMIIYSLSFTRSWNFPVFLEPCKKCSVYGLMLEWLTGYNVLEIHWSWAVEVRIFLSLEIFFWCSWHLPFVPSLTFCFAVNRVVLVFEFWSNIHTLAYNSSPGCPRHVFIMQTDKCGYFHQAIFPTRIQEQATPLVRCQVMSQLRLREQWIMN